MKRVSVREWATRPAVLACLLTLAAGCSAVPPSPVTDSRPNFLLIVADDLAYTDLGVYGGEIGTPNLDALASSGVLFTSFYTASTCSPTRAMLLSGTDNHLAGLGTMAGDHAGEQFGKPGYETYLNFRVASLAELLQDAGYHTYLAGKWHLGTEEHTGPAARGFEKSFALLNGGGGHFDELGLFSATAPATYREDGRPTSLPEGFYSTRFYAERMVEYIDAGRWDGRPFFGYLVFTAPHWPLQAPEESVARFRGRYDAGYDVLHAQRLAQLKSLGLLDASVEPYPRLPDVPAWEALDDEQRRIEARKMEIYAAMVHDLDRHVGRVVEHLKAIGEFENTFVLFLSDNGAEGHRLQQVWPELRDWIAECCDNSYANMGRADSYVDYGPGWARAGVGAFRMYKGFVNEGGIRVPAFASFPARFEGERVHRDFVSVMDVMPTLLELAGVSHPGTSYRNRQIVEMQGRSLLPMLEGRAASVHGEGFAMGWELFGRRAIRQGDWKLVWTTEPYGPSAWELFDLAEDPAESVDLTSAHPERRATLLDLWDDYMDRNGVVLSDEPLAY